MASRVYIALHWGRRHLLDRGPPLGVVDPCNCTLCGRRGSPLLSPKLSRAILRGVVWTVNATPPCSLLGCFRQTSVM